MLSTWFGIHTGTAIIGYSGFAVSAAYGLLFLLLYREIKASRFGRIYERLPSLELLAHMTVRAAVVGFVFLTVAMVAGIVWSLRLQYDFIRDPKFFTTVLLWVVYGACIGTHYLLGWHERRVIYFSLFGFAIMIFSMAAVLHSEPSSLTAPSTTCQYWWVSSEINVLSDSGKCVIALR